MSKNYKWDKNNRIKAGNDLRVVLFASRNKDNSHLDNFKERKRAFLAWFSGMNIPDWVEEEFQKFTNEGRYTELNRMYISINARDPEKVKKYLTIKLIENSEGVDLTRIEPIIAGSAARVENRRSDQKRWLFDWDKPWFSLEGQKKLESFMKDIEKAGGGEVEVYPTPHGAAVISEHGFDNRELKQKWGEVATPKKDDLLCARWTYNYHEMSAQVMGCTGAKV